jgi:hypothetical protein
MDINRKTESVDKISVYIVRFDRSYVVSLPDYQGKVVLMIGLHQRRDRLRVHMTLQDQRSTRHQFLEKNELARC